MEINLTQSDKLALTGVVKWVIGADPEDTDAGLDGFFTENNLGSYNEIYKEMDKKFNSIEEFKTFLKTISNVSSQKLIMDIAKDIALSDAKITKEEKEVFNALKKIWNL